MKTCKGENFSGTRCKHARNCQRYMSYIDSVVGGKQVEFIEENEKLKYQCLKSIKK